MWVVGAHPNPAGVPAQPPITALQAMHNGCPGPAHGATGRDGLSARGSTGDAARTIRQHRLGEWLAGSEPPARFGCAPGAPGTAEL